MRVDFYILRDNDNRELTACRLCEKAYKQGHKVYIHVNSSSHAAQIDDLLWAFRDGSFLPHEILNNDTDLEITAPIIIGSSDAPKFTHNDVLINLADHVPTFYAQFNRIAEIVSQDDNIKTISRAKFASYKKQEAELHHHYL